MEKKYTKIAEVHSAEEAFAWFHKYQLDTNLSLPEPGDLVVTYAVRLNSIIIGRFLGFDNQCGYDGSIECAGLGCGGGSNIGGLHCCSYFSGIHSGRKGWAIYKITEAQAVAYLL